MTSTDPDAPRGRDVHGAARVTPAGRSPEKNESNPVDTDATARGQAENRRTDLVVTAK
jgi:flagellar motor protein MotB